MHDKNETSRALIVDESTNLRVKIAPICGEKEPTEFVTLKSVLSRTNRPINFPFFFLLQTDQMSLYQMTV